MMMNGLIGRAGFGLATLAVSGTPVPARISADYCGSIYSPDGRYRASLTFVRNPVPSARTVSVFLCDRMFNCDTVYSGPHDAAVLLEWQSAGHLVVHALQGAIPAPEALAHVGGGRPPVSIRIERGRGPTREASGTDLAFDASQCRVEPPIGD